jgi:hypothetical protein
MSTDVYTRVERQQVRADADDRPAAVFEEGRDLPKIVSEKSRPLEPSICVQTVRHRVVKTPPHGNWLVAVPAYEIDLAAEHKWHCLAVSCL